MFLEGAQLPLEHPWFRHYLRPKSKIQIQSLDQIQDTNANLRPNPGYKSKSWTKSRIQIQIEILNPGYKSKTKPNPKDLVPNPNLLQDLLHP
jgi:hypothetical protein